MTRIDRSPFTDQDKAPQDTDVDGRHIWVPKQITFEQSIEAYDLAIQSNALHSFEDLVHTGTWHKYEQRAASLARKHPSHDPFISYLSTDHANGWTSPNSRQSYRSALIRMAARDILELSPVYWRQVITDEMNEDHRIHLIRSLKPNLDQDVRNQIKGAKERLCFEKVDKLNRAVLFLLQVPPDPHHTALRDRPTKEGRGKGLDESRSLASKKTALYALNQHQRRKAKTFPNYDWRSHFWATAVLPDVHLDDHRRACIATLMLTGCRPSEFSDDLGVIVHTSDTDGHSSLHFEIAGAKVSDEIDGHLGKGQSWREIDTHCQTDEAIWLFDYMRKLDQKSMMLKVPTMTHKQSGEVLMPIERHRRVSVSLGKLITRLGKIAFPHLRHKLTPYVFRHVFTSDFKAGGQKMDARGLPGALGHQSARTQQHYGGANTARGLTGNRALQVTAVRSLTHVRQPDRQSYPSTEDPRPQLKS